MSSLIHEAIIFAARKHDGQVRNGTDIPYVAHPMEVMQILTKNECTEEVIIAGLLHDTLEDTDTQPNEILSNFGGDVLWIVEGNSEDKSKTWKERKQHTLDHIASAPLEVRQVCYADKISNLRSMASELKKIGEKLWERFNAPKADIEWYYRGIAAALGSVPGTAGSFKLPMELAALIDEVFK